MTVWAPKRFWTEASVARVSDGWTVQLDGRQLRTPARAPLVVPTRALAQMIAAEWAAQQGTVRPETMPATRAANAAIDKTRGQRTEVAALVAAYGATDLLCYRADHPSALAARQAAAWDPILAWAETRLNVRFVRTVGVMPATQPAETLARLEAEVAAFDPFRLTALHDLASLPGSLVIGLAAAEGAFGLDTLWAAARIDEDWQIEHWGRDDEAEAAAAARRAAFLQAAAFEAACRAGGADDPQA